MMEICHVQNNAILTVSSGELGEKDYLKMLPLLNLSQKKAKKIRWLFQAKNFTKLSFLRFLRLLVYQHKNSFERIAFVGEQGLEKLFQSVNMRRIVEVRYFNSKELDKARKWILQ